MKERPILFQGPMVRALLDGRKTQTRRLVKPMPYGAWMPSVGFYSPTLVTKGGEEYPGPEVFGAFDEVEGVKCPYGPPGDRLWVREAFSSHGVFGANGRIVYRADLGDDAAEPHGLNWAPSIFMRPAACRIRLEITAVRVERLHDISGDDAIAEGCQIPCTSVGVPALRITGRVKPSDFSKKHPFKEWTGDDYARFEYAELWETINGAGSWALNPWVWVIEFRRVM